MKHCDLKNWAKSRATRMYVRMHTHIRVRVRVRVHTHTYQTINFAGDEHLTKVFCVAAKRKGEKELLWDT